MQTPESPSDTDTVVTGRDLADVASARALAPTRKALAFQYGEHRIVDEPNGQWRLTGLSGNEAMEWMKPALRKQRDRVHRNAADVPRETLRDESGGAFTVQARFAESVAKARGLKPRINWGRGRRSTGYDPHAPLRTAAEIAAEREG